MPADPPVLSGDDVLLVPVRAGASERLLAGDLDGRVAGRGWPHEDTAHALAFADRGGATWLVVDSDGAVVGELGTKAAPDPTGTVEIGYGLAAQSRGRGLGTRAVATLLAYLDRQPDVQRIVAHVAVGNLASARLLARLGFRAGDRPVGGELEFTRAADTALV
ncbi:MAG: hypothetical protein QOJ03_655 [Frankiaceae bacterium]|nr:hypothetical protein [Frankiaceae bacterium]